MKSLTILLLLIFCSSVVLGQQGSDAPANDTTSAQKILLLDPGVALGKPTLLLPPSFESGFGTTFPLFFYAGAHTGIPPSLISMGFKPKVDMLASIHLQRERESGLQTLHMILGTVTAGAVAYIAYRHVMKYGFWK
ncbi:MAG: hypothetical protein WBG01_11460 [Bacteroidota bacterium]